MKHIVFPGADLAYKEPVHVDGEGKVTVDLYDAAPNMMNRPLGQLIVNPGISFSVEEQEAPSHE